MKVNPIKNVSGFQGIHDKKTKGKHENFSTDFKHLIFAKANELKQI